MRRLLPLGWTWDSKRVLDFGGHVHDAPPLPVPDGHFDLVLAISAFDHIVDRWSAWLVELHRVLADDGVMIATLMGEGMSLAVAGEPWSEDAVGMTVFGCGADPMVLYSPWWVRAHWGRIFDVVETIDDGAPGRHWIVKLRKKPVRLSAEKLERSEPGEPREVAALQRQLRQLQREIVAARSEPG